MTSPNYASSLACAAGTRSAPTTIMTSFQTIGLDELERVGGGFPGFGPNWGRFFHYSYWLGGAQQQQQVVEKPRGRPEALVQIAKGEGAKPFAGMDMPETAQT